MPSSARPKELLGSDFLIGAAGVIVDGTEIIVVNTDICMQA
jgi:hypothetical protein